MTVVTSVLLFTGMKKIIKSLTHTGNDIENVAVILTGTDGQEVLLSIIGI